ncbi:hypothetical protein COMA2_110154 [Candidatus Nitrospira nitrificans]|uniref:Uncharacterized protein n=1 Tax=Candidatus Nitrospira nitrificans TaxID=1742973 RepID=A0A0S4L8F9_9BACT|nr:hypothetical protein COMA2_110154 [Candidatus Nitrospira nitrificans]
MLNFLYSVFKEQYITFVTWEAQYKRCALSCQGTHSKNSGSFPQAPHSPGRGIQARTHPPTAFERMGR